MRGWWRWSFRRMALRSVTWVISCTSFSGVQWHCCAASGCASDHVWIDPSPE